MIGVGWPYNVQALQTATTHPLEFFGLQKMLGSVAVGQRAEFVLLDGDLLADLNNFDRRLPGQPGLAMLRPTA